MADKKDDPSGGIDVVFMGSKATELEDCVGAKLESIREVNKALAATIRLIKAGHLGHQRGAVLINGYATLLKSLQDGRDSKWLPRVRELWAEREQAKQAPSESVQ